MTANEGDVHAVLSAFSEEMPIKPGKIEQFILRQRTIYTETRSMSKTNMWKSTVMPAEGAIYASSFKKIFG